MAAAGSTRRQSVNAGGVLANLTVLKLTKIRFLTIKYSRCKIIKDTLILNLKLNLIEKKIQKKIQITWVQTHSREASINHI